MRLIEQNNSAAASPSCFCSNSGFISFVVALSLRSSLNEGETVAGKVAVEWTCPSQLEPTDGVDRVKSEHKAETANQLVMTSPVTKKRTVDQPIRTESTERVTDWTNRTGAMGFLSSRIQRSRSALRPRHLLIANWELWQKSYWYLP